MELHSISQARRVSVQMQAKVDALKRELQEVIALLDECYRVLLTESYKARADVCNKITGYIVHKDKRGEG